MIIKRKLAEEEWSVCTVRFRASCEHVINETISFYGTAVVEEKG